MEKLIVLLGATEPGRVPQARGGLRDALFALAPELRRAGARQLGCAVADLDDAEAARVPQFAPDGLLDAAVSFWLDSLDARAPLEALVAPLAERSATYLVTESVPRAPAAASGPQLAGVSLLTTFPKPDALDDATFLARWHGSHTPLSLEIHPLLHYVRNSVARVLTPGAPPYRAIVTEAVDAPGVLLDVERFYGGEANRRRAVKDLLGFTDFRTLNSVLVHEYRLDP